MTIELRVFPDWGRAWPVWTSTANDAEARLVDASISPGLAGDLTQWAADWEDTCTPEGGWPSDRDPLLWTLAGHRLCWRLQRELGPGYRVVPAHDDSLRTS